MMCASHSPLTLKNKKQLKYEIKLYEDFSPNKSTICPFKHASDTNYISIA
jgi:hypothetical protein